MRPPRVSLILTPDSFDCRLSNFIGATEMVNYGGSCAAASYAEYRHIDNACVTQELYRFEENQRLALVRS